MNRKSAYFIAVGVFLLCFAMIFGGNFLENAALTYAGVGLLFGGGLLFALITVFVMFHRARKKADEMDKPGQDKTPEGEGEAPNRYSEATGAFAYTIHGYRHSDRKHKILMILFITSVLGSVFAGLVCLFFKQFVAAYALFGCFGLILLIGIGAAIIASRR